jgi:hypothetical protein
MSPVMEEPSSYLSFAYPSKKKRAFLFVRVDQELLGLGGACFIISPILLSTHT